MGSDPRVQQGISAATTSVQALHSMVNAGLDGQQQLDRQRLQIELQRSPTATLTLPISTLSSVTPQSNASTDPPSIVPTPRRAWVVVGVVTLVLGAGVVGYAVLRPAVCAKRHR